MKDHRVTIRRTSRSILYWPVCSCKWEGPATGSRDYAVKAGDAHLLISKNKGT